MVVYVLLLKCSYIFGGICSVLVIVFIKVQIYQGYFLYVFVVYFLNNFDIMFFE